MGGKDHVIFVLDYGHASWNISTRPGLEPSGFQVFGENPLGMKCR